LSSSKLVFSLLRSYRLSVPKWKN